MAENDQIELELEGSEATEVQVEAPPSDGGEDQFEQAENATQSRINRLTKKMREAERRENEALNYAKQVQAEANSLKQRMSSLDNSYVNEYSTRVETQLAQTEKEMARAMELGDTQAAVEAQRKLTSLSIENDRASQAKMQQERQRQTAAQPQQQQVQQQPQQQQVRRPDRKAEEWAEQNDWFGQDEAMTFAAFGKPWAPPSMLDAPPAPDGYKHRWIRSETRGFDDTKNISAKMREGWELVRKDEYPDFESPVVESGKYEGVFGIGGLMLARIPEETVAERTAYFSNRNRDQMEAVDSDMMRENAHSTMTINKPDRQSRVTFGGPRKN